MQIAFLPFLRYGLLASFVFLWAMGGSMMAVAGEAGVRGVDPKFSALIARCAPTVHPETMAALISAESRGHLYAIADAGPVGLPWSVRKGMVRSYYDGSLEAAVWRANWLIASGHTVSLGMAQVNDRNLRRLGLSVREVFEPCANIAAGGKIITEFYQKAVHRFGPGQRALMAAISAYNSGDWERGARDGYVKLVYQQRGRELAMRSNAVAVRRGSGGGEVGRSRALTEDRLFPMAVTSWN